MHLDSGEKERAIKSLTEAVSIYRELAKRHPNAHYPSSAWAMQQLSKLQASVESKDEAGGINESEEGKNELL